MATIKSKEFFKSGTFVTGVCLVVSSIIFSVAFYASRFSADSISVTGSASLVVVSDSAKFSGNFSRIVKLSGLKSGYNQMSSDLKIMKDFLKKQNIDDKDITISTVSMNQNYDYNDIFIKNIDNLVLRPETTPSSYIYAQYLLNNNLIIPPFVVHQNGKSFRKEQINVLKNMRLKEFYQQEFQCIYSEDTLNDYQTKILETLRLLFEKVIGKPARIIESDRLPDYSLKTMDIEIDNGDKWMEIASISKRIDFPQKYKFNNKNAIEKNLIVLEIAIGLDRCIYNYFK